MTAPVLAPEDLDDRDQEILTERYDRSVDTAEAGYDPEAPHGRNPRTGKPYKRSPEWRKGLADALARGRANNQAKAPPRKAASRSKAAPAGKTDYRPGVVAMLQLPAFALAMAGRTRPALALDGATLTYHSPAIAEAVQQTADADDRVAAILDKVLAAGPYGALLGALMPVALQLAANHKVIAPVAELGIMTPDQLVAALDKPAP